MTLAAMWKRAVRTYRQESIKSEKQLEESRQCNKWLGDELRRQRAEVERVRGSMLKLREHYQGRLLAASEAVRAMQVETQTWRVAAWQARDAREAEQQRVRDLQAENERLRQALAAKEESK